MNNSIKLLRQASSMVASDPRGAEALFVKARPGDARFSGALQKAWSVLVRYRLDWYRGKVQPEALPSLFDAAKAFYANEHFDEAVMTLAISAQIAFVVGDMSSALRHSLMGFREMRASPDCRLLASRALLWAVPEGESRVVDGLLDQVRELARSAAPGIGSAIASSYLIFRDFKEVMYRAGVPTDSQPYPTPANLTIPDSREAVMQLIMQLERHLPALRECLPTEPVPMLFLAALRGYVHGSASCAQLASEVAEASSVSAEPYIHAVIGVSHLRHGESAQAAHHLQQCLQAFHHHGRVDEGRPWLFYLGLALRAEGRFREAMDIMDRFWAGLGRSQQSVRAIANTIEKIVEELTTSSAAPAPSTVRLVRSTPHYVKSAIHWMRTHMDQSISVPNIVAAVGVSRRTLETGFREFRNRSVAEELRWMRMQRAMELLRSPDTGLVTVRQQVGYRSASTFSKDFRKAFGVPPSKSSGVGQPPSASADASMSPTDGI